MSRYIPLLNTFGLITLLFGLSLLGPFALSHFLIDGAQKAYDEALIIIVGLGIALWLSTYKHKGELAVRDGFLLVAMTWTLLPALATIPLLLYFPELSFIDAYFETASGLTASGATVLDGLDNLPPSINLWRTQLCWLGGMGIVVLAVAILPLLGVGGAQLFKAETPTPMKDNRLTPRINETAKGLWMVYFAATLACILAYKVAGMSWLDALMHGFSTVSLGGFSSHDASFGYFDSVTIEMICVVFTLFSALNFATHFMAWHRRSMRAYWRDPEAAWVIGVILGSALLIAIFLYAHRYYEGFGESLRYAVFNVVSVATTGGFSNTDYNQWPIFAPLWMLFLSAFVSSSGSTGGGIKMIRALVLQKQALREFTRILHPRAEVPLKLGGSKVENKLIFAVLAFMLIYGSSMIVMTLLLTATGLDLTSAFSAVVACLNNMGPGLHQVGPSTTFAVLNDFQTAVCSAAMLLGRLELFSLLVIFTPGFWRK
ncbi:MAG TPA: potassium transporter TrkG [Burkholderiales bacterium]|nr:potassium transporter TrkG [Burkholderiales bacterium]